MVKWYIEVNICSNFKISLRTNKLTVKKIKEFDQTSQIWPVENGFQNILTMVKIYKSYNCLTY